jgi:hypothetical protein
MVQAEGASSVFKGLFPALVRTTTYSSIAMMVFPSVFTFTLGRVFA